MNPMSDLGIFDFCQGRGNSSNEVQRLWQGVTEGTGGVFSQYTSFRFSLSWKRFLMIYAAPPILHKKKKMDIELWGFYQCWRPLPNKLDAAEYLYFR